MKAMIENQTISDVDYEPHHRGEMNRFKVRLKDDKGHSAIVYLFSSRDAVKTKKFMALLKKGNRLTAELTIVIDPESGGDRNVAMITKIIDSIPPSLLTLTA